jgi:alkanesulfonate monooxygenase SsuD/methylene tetrahydromethanopterin reductase-like flavin-dependent oxidoreductase (luciferase family)
MVKVGIHIVPLMAANDVIDIAIAAERIGYDYCLVADEGFHPDIYACLGAIARETERIVIGPVTNGYTRHPAVTAAGIATVHTLSNGRAFVALVAGGSMVLDPMGIDRERPYRVLRDTVQVMKSLWTGESVTWEGDRHRLSNAQLSTGPQSIPIWVSSRGPLLLKLAGREADGVLLTVKPDLEAAFAIASSAAPVGQQPERIYLGRICYTPEMFDEQRATMPYILKDSPERVLRSLGFDDVQIQRIGSTGDATDLEDLMTDELLAQYQIHGDAETCAEQAAALVSKHRLDTLMVDVLSQDLDENLELLQRTHNIITDGRR